MGETMNKYILYYTSSVYDIKSFMYVKGISIGGDIHPPKTRTKLAEFTDEKEALDELNKYKSNINYDLLNQTVELEEYFLDEFSDMMVDIFTIGISELSLQSFERYVLLTKADPSVIHEKNVESIEQLLIDEKFDLDKFLNLKAKNKEKYIKELNRLYEKYLNWKD